MFHQVEKVSFIRFAKICFLVLIILSCSEEPTGNNAPTLTYLGLSNTVMQQGFGQDTVFVFLEFEDIDGDIVGGNTMNISVIDNRDGTVDPISFPVLPSLNNGQRGTIQLTILSPCCIYAPELMIPACERDPDFPPNMYTYDIFITDGAGNPSNRVTTETITLTCN